MDNIHDLYKQLSSKFTLMIDKEGQEYARYCSLCDKFDISRSTVRRLTEAMKEQPKYRHSFLRIGHKLALVNLKDFRQFLKERDGAYLRGKLNDKI